MTVLLSQGRAGARGGGNTPVQNDQPTSTIDWLEYSVSRETFLPQLFEFQRDQQWQPASTKGRNGYALLWKWQGVECWTEHETSGPHVVASGKGCADIAEAGERRSTGFNWRNHLLWLCATRTRFSRLDVAIDVVGGGLDVETLAAAVREGRIVSRWKGASWLEMKKIGQGVNGGHTLYAGSPKSDSRLCIYNKAAEQGTEDGIPWVRVEFRARHEAANALAHLIASYGMPAAMSAIRGYADFLDDTGNTLECWKEALQEAGKRPLHVKKRGGTYDSMATWLEGDVAAPLAALVDANGGDWGKVQDIVQRGRQRYSAKHRSLIEERQRRLTELGE